MTVTQCSVLYVRDGGHTQDCFASDLRTLGFAVLETEDLPTDEVFQAHHVVIVRVRSHYSLPMLGARLRAKVHFGRRVLIALVPEDTTAGARREAVHSGFDLTLPVGSLAVLVP